MQTLWIVLITCEGVEAVEAAGGGVVVSCSQVLRAIGVGPFAAVEQAGQRGGGGGQAARRKKNGLLGSGLPAAYARPNRVLFATAVCLHFSLFTAVNILGVPAAHVSTGIHQVRY